MFAACSLPYVINKTLNGEDIDSASVYKKASTLDLVTGIVVIAFGLLSPYLGIKLSPEVFYLTLGIGAAYALASLTDLIKGLKDEKTKGYKRILINTALLIGISTLALGILGMKLGFLSSDLSYALVGIGTGSSFYAIISELSTYGVYRRLREAETPTLQGPYYPFGLCQPKYKKPIEDAV